MFCFSRLFTRIARIDRATCQSPVNLPGLLSAPQFPVKTARLIWQLEYLWLSLAISTSLFVLYRSPFRQFSNLCSLKLHKSELHKSDLIFVFSFLSHPQLHRRSTMTASAPDDYFSLLYSHFAIDSFPGLIKTLLFYLLIAACTIQTFYPVFMIIAMVIRQLGIFAHFFHKVSSLFVRRFSATFLVDCVRHTLGNYF